LVLFFAALNAWAGGAQRIVSTAPSITETIFAMGLGNRLVGNTVYCNYPPEARRIKKIGDLMKPDIERILAVHPDLVVVLKHPSTLPEELARVHIPYIEVDAFNMDAVYAQARAIGKAADASAAAEQLIQKIQGELQAVAKLAAGKPKPSVAFIVSHAPGRLEGLIAGSGNSFFSDLLNCAGGTNVFSDVSAPYPKISLEEILARNPEVIMQLAGDDPDKQANVTEVWQPHKTLRAVANGRVYPIPSGPMVVPGPRAAEAARTLLYLLHPELPHPELRH
jgi:iron complex transport system substrate-binding protein